MNFLKANLWLIVLIVASFGVMGYSSYTDTKTTQLLNQEFHVSPAETREAMVDSVNRTTAINKTLAAMMDSTNADRAYLFQFHNGARLVSGKHYYYYSNTHEIVRPGVSSEMGGLQKLPMSLLVPTWIPLLIRGDSFAEWTRDEKHEYSKKLLEDQGIVYIAISPIMDETKSYPIGFVGIDYVGSEVNENAIIIVKEYTAIIRNTLLWN